MEELPVTGAGKTDFLAYEAKIVEDHQIAGQPLPTREAVLKLWWALGGVLQHRERALQDQAARKDNPVRARLRTEALERQRLDSKRRKAAEAAALAEQAAYWATLGASPQSEILSALWEEYVRDPPQTSVEQPLRTIVGVLFRSQYRESRHNETLTAWMEWGKWRKWEELTLTDDETCFEDCGPLF